MKKMPYRVPRNHEYQFATKNVKLVSSDGKQLKGTFYVEKVEITRHNTWQNYPSKSQTNERVEVTCQMFRRDKSYPLELNTIFNIYTDIKSNGKKIPLVIENARIITIKHNSTGLEELKLMGERAIIGGKAKMRLPREPFVFR